MKYRNAFFITCLIIFIISMLGVSAGDVNETQLANHVNETLMESSQENILSDVDGATFTSLQKKIDDAKSGSTITLDRDYTYDEGFSKKGIEIDKDLTINGNGHTLNGLAQSRIFIIKLGIIHQNKVTLNNIKFANANSDLYGGAIFNYGDLTIENCEFSNNHVKYAGGAVASVGYLECKNSKFNSNVADGDGGAIFTLSFRGSFDYLTELLKDSILDGNFDLLSVIANNFTLQYAKEQVTGCEFTNNVAKGSGGGAIYAFGNIDIKSSTFTSNKAGKKGGAVFGNKDLYISNSKFTSNLASSSGGAVYFRCHDQSGHYVNGKWVSETNYYSNSIQDSAFTKNSASKGGAIYAFRTSSKDTVHCAKAVRCTFTDNKASSGRDVYGGTTSGCVFNYLKLTLKTVKVKKSAKKLVLTAKLTKGKTLIAGKKVAFKFNGKTYKAKTNKKGIAKVSIKKSVLKKLKVGKKVKYQAKYLNLIVKKTAKVKK